VRIAPHDFSYIRRKWGCDWGHRTQLPPENATHTPNAISSRAKDKLNEQRIKSFIKKGVAGKKLSDGGGMYLQITPAGSAIWRIKYRLGGVERTYTVGAYPRVDLKAARGERDEVKDLLSDGKDPVQARQVARVAAVTSSGNTFGEIASAWLEKEKAGWSEIHYTKSKRAIERDVLPLLGSLPVADVGPAMVTKVIEKIVKRGARASTRHRRGSPQTRTGRQTHGGGTLSGQLTTL
jgi:hypothetical protein